MSEIEPPNDSGRRRPSNHAADGWKKTDDEIDPPFDSIGLKVTYLNATAARLRTTDDIHLGRIEFVSEDARDFFAAFLGRLAREAQR